MVPRDFGFKMPPEWTRHSRTLMAWPLEEAAWPGPFEEVLLSFAHIAKKIAEFEPVTVIAKPEFAGEAADFCGPTVEVVEMGHNDSWMRDMGPTFVMNKKGEIAGINWIFNAWGGKYPCEEDNLTAAGILDRFHVPRFDAPIVLEGGSIHVDGEGTLITTEECLLNKNRNPHLSRKEIEGVVKQYLNVEKIIWLKRGLYGDDTDGHVDNVACFARPGAVMVQTCSDPKDPNYEISRENIEILKSAVDAKGRALDIIQIEQPSPVYYEKMRLTLSYINFYFVNGGIILPVFGGDNLEADRQAEMVMKKTFPHRRIAKVSGLTIARGGGNVHCLTQQMPQGLPARL
ncbi:MAG: agmatine deiminase family protein [Clostridiales bacterium]|nr:agmatine deiminase family protein [Eubacteriales bacterium]MDH7565367.1 agmatine deiminase family protein [Clostridiales bacterium]